MNGGTSFRLVLLVVVNFLLDSPVNGGVVERSIRMVREVYPPDIEPENDGVQPQVCIVGDVVYGADEAVPAEQPCLKCRCQPPGVQCETVQCAKKPGCKAIHRPNKCCPDYQCECEHNGKIYANGEKLETNPGSECKVCYCRGGEIQCAEVSCYIRKDCEGKRVPGTCCPKYDHCPPIDTVLNRSSTVTEPPSNTFKPIILELWQESNSTEIPSSPTVNSIPEDSNKVPDASGVATVAPTFTEIFQKDEGSDPRITIQEIIPERKEIPITAPPKIFISEPQGTLLIEEALPTSDNSSNDLNVDSEPDSSEVSEVFQHPPPVLRIGDKLLFFKNGNLVSEKDTTTSDSVITIIGAEGLQRGGVEESLEFHEVKIEPENDIQETATESVESDKEVVLNTIPNITKEVGSENDTAETNDIELKLAESSHILSLVKRKDKTLTTTSTQSAITENEDVSTTLTSSIEEPRSSDPPIQVTDSTTEAATTVSTEASSTEARTESQTKNTEPVIEQNPAYPPIPDIMPAGEVSQKFEAETENDTSTAMEGKILPEVFDFLSNSTRKNLTQREWLKFAAKVENPESKDNETLADFRAGLLPEELLKQRSPIDENDENSTDIIEDVTSYNSTETTTERKTIATFGDEDKLLSEGAQLIAEVNISANEFDGDNNNNNGTEAATPPTNSEATESVNVGTNATAAKSMESLEFDSGEQTTPKTNHSSIMTDENASVEDIKMKDKSETNDMIHTSERSRDFELGSVEIFDNASGSLLKDVEMIGTLPSAVQTSTDNAMKKEVEFINVSDTPKPTKLAKVETSTYELLPTPEEAKSKKTTKREIASGSSDDHVFKDLEEELTADDSSQPEKSPEEEQREADQIFKELLDESEGKTTEARLKSEEVQKVDSLSNALADIALKGKAPDASVFRLIGGLFGGQRQ